MATEQWFLRCLREELRLTQRMLLAGNYCGRRLSSFARKNMNNLVSFDDLGFLALTDGFRQGEVLQNFGEDFAEKSTLFLKSFGQRFL